MFKCSPTLVKRARFIALRFTTATPSFHHRAAAVITPKRRHCGHRPATSHPIRDTVTDRRLRNAMVKQGAINRARTILNSQFSTVKDYLTTAADGKNYNVTFYSLDMILAVGFRVRSKRGVQFRRWANSVLKEFMQKGFVMDDERLKNPDGRPDYYDELLERIRDIRASD